ncbi:MAG: Hint domain-containing protein [Albidovulum sp.]|uniref:Hint domain-containing protein n=1 Tax=Albidovulum sp. TaxID=1872424 RepID=UPI003CC4309C
MATTFNWIYLGTSTSMLDPTEGNTLAEGRNLFLGQTYGSAADPLYTHITSTTMINNGGSATALDANNTTANDQFTTNIGAGTQTFTFDSSVQYNATITYADGTTASVTAVFLQSTTGQMFLAPEFTANTDTTVYEAKPIQSITFNSVAQTGGDLTIDRVQTGFDDGWVEGTSGNDLINAGYVEPIANGSDRIDGGDGISGAGTAWQDDRVRAGAGNDTVLSGLGNDYVDGGTGADSIDGGDGNDSLFGGSGTFNDTILGGIGNDTIDGGDGNDSLLGGAGTDSILGGAGNDTADGGSDADYIDGGDGNDSLFGGTGAFNDTILGGIGNDTIDGGDGNDSLLGGAGTDSILGGTGNDFVDGGSDADFIDGGDGNDSLFGGTGAFNDTILGGIGNDTIDGGDGSDSLLGGAGTDSILGGTGNDTFDGGTGADTMVGGTGDDIFRGITAGDVVDGSENTGDKDVLDLAASGWTWATTNILYSTPDHENGTVQFLDGSGAVIGSMTFSNIETIVPCFTHGTLIETETGPVAVEMLKVGDRVLTLDRGYQPVRWIGRRDLSSADLVANPKLRPVLFAQGSCRQGLPLQDMHLSPQHRLLLSGHSTELVTGEAEVFAPAQHFVGLPGIVQDSGAAGVSYIHLMFDRHEVIRSDGLWTESFQPALATVSGMDAAQREEINSLFPGLCAANSADYPAARSTVKRHEARVILAS